MQTRTNILKDYLIFTSFNEEEIQQVEQLLTSKKYEQGEIIIKEDTLSRELFFIQQGQVEILKKEHGNEYTFAEIGEKEIFGEVSFLDTKKRSTTVRAKTDVEVFIFEEENFRKLSDKFSYLQYKFLLQLSQITMARLRNTNQKVLEEMDLRKRLSKFLMIMVACLSLTTCIIGFMDVMRSHLPFHWIALGISLVALLLCFMMIKAVRKPLHFFGLNLVNWKKALWEGILLSVFFSAVCLLVWPEKNFTAGFIYLCTSGRLFVYLFVSFLQEFVARGVVQTSFMEFYEDKKGYLSIFTTSVTFALLHIHYGMALTVATLVMGIFLGALYLRHKSLVGIILIHFVLGSLANIYGFIK